MALFYATTTGITSPITLKIRVNNKALVRSIEITKSKQFSVWQWLDLLVEIMPQHIHAHLDQFEVYLCKNPLNAPHPTCISNTFIVVKHLSNGGEKFYPLDDPVNYHWLYTIHPAHLRAILYWWRGNRNQYPHSKHEWHIFKIWEEQ